MQIQRRVHSEVEQRPASVPERRGLEFIPASLPMAPVATPSTVPAAPAETGTAVETKEGKK